MNLSEVQVSASALQHNVRALRKLTPVGCQVAAVVKGNAYGHGLPEVVRAIDDEVDCFQVDDLDELRALREVTDKRALLLGFVPRDQIAEALKLGCELAIFDIDRLEAISRAGSDQRITPRVHLKIDARLGRLGVLPERLPEMVSALRYHRGLQVVAAYAHYANIEDTTDLSHAEEQSRQLDACLRVLRNSGWPELKRHLAATSGLMARPAEADDLVRLGIGVYGLYPSEALRASSPELVLEPALRWVTHLAQVKDIPAGHPVGYGLTFVAARPMRIGIVPQGYADGLDRGLSNAGAVLIQGRRCPMIGRVAMNMVAVDLGEIAAGPEEEVVLLGAQGADRITAEEVADSLGTINYEVVARISPLLPRRSV